MEGVKIKKGKKIFHKAVAKCWEPPVEYRHKDTLIHKRQRMDWFSLGSVNRRRDADYPHPDVYFCQKTQSKAFLFSHLASLHHCDIIILGWCLLLPSPPDQIGFTRTVANEKKCVTGRRMRMNRLFSCFVKMIKYFKNYRLSNVTLKTPFIDFSFAPMLSTQLFSRKLPDCWQTPNVSEILAFPCEGKGDRRLSGGGWGGKKLNEYLAFLIEPLFPPHQSALWLTASPQVNAD